MLHQVQRAVVPHLPMEHTISHWNHIAGALASAWRQRRPQIGALTDYGTPDPGTTQQTGDLK